MNHPLIKLDCISKDFNGKKVLSAVDLTINNGQIITLIGPNGAGKTTLVKIVLGLMSPTGGEIFRSSNLRLGYMPQKLHIDPTLPITLERFLKLAEKDTKLCCDVLNEVGIINLMKCPLSSLSGGEMQRALLARAILREPNLLVLDEATNALDIKTEKNLIQNLTQFKFNITIILISHRISVLKKCDQIIVIENGKIEFNGKYEKMPKLISE